MSIHNFYLEKKRKELLLKENNIKKLTKQQKQVNEAINRAKQKGSNSVLTALKFKAHNISNRIIIEKTQMLKLKRELRLYDD